MDGPVAVFKKRTVKATARKPPPQRAPSASDSDGSSSDNDSDSGHAVKRRKTGAGAGGVVKSSTSDHKTKAGYEGTTKFAADRSATIAISNDATKQSNWYEEAAETSTSTSHDAKSLLGTTRNNNPSSSSSAAQAKYSQLAKPEPLIKRSENAPARNVGPIKAPTNIRTITVTDYAPDVCKDYKQTGFCGFGDSCKYLHAREDYAHGWQLDREWDINQKTGKKTDSTTVSSAGNRGQGGEGDGDAAAAAADEALLEKIPFACVICKEPYKNPVVTRCSHYFCEDCALGRYRKTPTCAACGTGTGGVFNGAKQLKKLLERKREREKRIKEEKREAGEEVSDEDGDGAGEEAGDAKK